MTTSVSYEVYATARDELIYTYHEMLATVLKNLSYDGYVPTLNELQIEMLKRKTLEMYLFITVGPYIRTPAPRVTPAVQPLLYKQIFLEELKNHGNNILHMYKHNLCQQLKQFDLQGVLDFKVDSNRVSVIKNRFNGAILHKSLGIRPPTQ